MLLWWWWSFGFYCSIPFPFLQICVWIYSLILHSKNKSSLINEDQVRVHETMRPLCFVFSRRYSKMSRMWCSQMTQCHNNVWKQSAAFSAITVDFHWNSNAPKPAFKAFLSPLRALSSYISTTALHSHCDPGMHFLCCRIIAKDRTLSTNVVVHPRHILCQTWGLAFFLNGFDTVCINTPIFVKMISNYIYSLRLWWGLTKGRIW